jgi:LPXTG-motif cell wall-anchored protein
MTFSTITRPRTMIAAAVLTLGWVANQASAGLPDLPPFLPPPVGISDLPPPVIAPPPPIHDPPPVRNAPEPASLVIGLIGAGVAGFVARRRKRSA